MAFHNRTSKQMKICLVGDESVGKTSIVLRFAKDTFQHNQKATVVVSFMSRSVNIDGEMIEYLIWDTAGEEKFRSMMKKHYRDSAAAIVVYDIVSYNSFQYMKSWVKEVTKWEPKAKLVVLGNKCDLKEQRQVPYDDGKSYADEVNAIFMETSAKTGENIEEVFFEIGKYYILLKLKFKRMFQAIIVETANKEPRFFLSSLDTFLHNKLVVSVPT